MIQRLSARYGPHPDFLPADKGAKVWRYMDFTKFASLLDTSALFFSRADQLPDAWEGAHTVWGVLGRPVFWTPQEDEVGKFHRSLRQHTFVSCWHMNDVESAAMWKLYVSQNEGIAIQTTFDRFTASFQGDESNIFDVHVGRVRYLDYDRDVFPEGNTFLPFLHKRLSFEHEHELRAIIQPVWPGGNPLVDSDPYAEGLLVDIDLHNLIECVYVAPTSETWFKDLVTNVAKRYGLRAPIQQSDLARDPVY